MKNKILSILITQSGSKHIKSQIIEQTLNVSGSVVRKLINEIIEEEAEKENGWLVMSDSDGYYIPTNYAEALEGLAWIENRIWKQLNRRKLIRKMVNKKYTFNEPTFFEMN